MDAALARLHALLAAADSADSRRHSDVTRSTNRQRLFRMIFGYLVVRTLLPLVRVVNRRPSAAAGPRFRTFATSRWPRCTANLGVTSSTTAASSPSDDVTAPT